MVTPSGDRVDFPDVPDVLALWGDPHRLGPLAAWNSVISFENTLAKALDAMGPGIDRAAVIAEVYGPGFVSPRERLGWMLRRDRQGRRFLDRVWADEGRSVDARYDERSYWRRRGVPVSGCAEHRRRRRVRSRPRSRRFRRVARQGAAGDSDLADEPAPARVADSPEGGRR